MPKLCVLIIGCGKIAGGFDSARTDPAELPVTHAGAYARDGRFKISGCVEPDDERRLAFMRRWGIGAGFRTIDEARSSGARFDVISICSPTKAHAHDLEVSLDIGPQLIFCEKPVTDSAAKTEQIVERCRKKRIPLAVNYTRRWDPAIADLKADIRVLRWGQLRCVVGHYNKGLLNNGSHLLDLLTYLLGPLRILKAGKPVHDHTPEDPSVPLWLEAADDLPVHVVCGNAADFALFELELLFSGAVITMEEGGLFWRERTTVDSARFQGYRVLGEGTRRPGGYGQATLRSIDNIFRTIQQGDKLESSGESAVAAQRLCEEVKQP